MSPFDNLVQAATQRVLRVVRVIRGWDHHRACHLALAVVHAVTVVILAAGSTWEAILAGVAAVIYAVLSLAPRHRN